jgi:hypothetical protein
VRAYGVEGHDPAAGERYSDRGISAGRILEVQEPLSFKV